MGGEVKSLGESSSSSDYMDWYSEFNFGVENFLINPMYFPVYAVRNNMSLHLAHAIGRFFCME